MGMYAETYERGRDAGHEAVTVERIDPNAAIVTMNEPEHLNALSAAICVQLNEALRELDADESIRTIILTGAGAGFSAGGEMQMMRSATERITEAAGSTDVWRWIRGQFGAAVRTIARSDMAFIAALNGPAAGVGLAFALACDLALASERARLVPAFGRIGLLPEVGTSWALSRRLGYQGAFAFYVEGRHLDAEEAHELGLVHELVPAAELLARSVEWAERVAALPPHAMAMTKPLLRAAVDSTWETSLTMEEYAEANCFTTGPFREAVAGFEAGGATRK